MKDSPGKKEKLRVHRRGETQANRQPAGYEVQEYGPTESPDAPVHVIGGGSIQAQTACLSASQLHCAQRHALLTRVGRAQGNLHVQRLVGALRRAQDGTAIAQRQGVSQPGRPTRTHKWGRTGESYKTTGYDYQELPGKKALYVSGISYTDPTQAILDVCFLASSLSALALTHPQVIRNAIEPPKPGQPPVYKVKLYKKTQRKWVPQTITVDAKAVYAKISGSRKVKVPRPRRRPKTVTESLYHLQITKPATRKTPAKVVGEKDIFVPHGHKVDLKTGAIVGGGANRWVTIGMGSTQYRLSVDGTKVAAVAPPPTRAIALRPAQPKWTLDYKLTPVRHVAGISARSRGVWELWPLVIEKALAKLLGGYRKLDKVRTPRAAGAILSMLTGAQTEVAEKRRGRFPRGLDKRLIKAHQARRPMIALCRVSSSTLGLVGKHYYTVVRVSTGKSLLDPSKIVIEKITLRDPRSKGTAGVVDVDWDDFKKHFSGVALGRVPKPPRRRATKTP